MDQFKPQPPQGIQESREKLKLRLLLADDDPHVLNMLVARFTRLGFEVDAVENGNILLERLSDTSKEYDIVWTDKNMPGLTGLEVAEWVRKNIERYKNLPIVLSSGEGTNQEALDRVLSETLGIVYVPKPADIKMVKEALTRFFP